jgi:hypothetical protein
VVLEERRVNAIQMEGSGASIAAKQFTIAAA